MYNFFLHTKRSKKNALSEIKERTQALERKMGIEPTPSAWEAEVLPLNYSRKGMIYYMPFDTICQVNFL